jgi:hypothetical protein
VFSAELRKKTCFLRGGHFFAKSPVWPVDTGDFFFPGEKGFLPLRTLPLF